MKKELINLRPHLSTLTHRININVVLFVLFFYRIFVILSKEFYQEYYDVTDRKDQGT